MTPTTNHSALPAITGFAFVVVAYAETFWIAILCLVGAAVFQLVYRLTRGDLTLTELRDRAEAARSGFAHPDRTDDAGGGHIRSSRVV